MDRRTTARRTAKNGIVQKTTLRTCVGAARNAALHEVVDRPCAALRRGAEGERIRTGCANQRGILEERVRPDETTLATGIDRRMSTTGNDRIKPARAKEILVARAAERSR